MEKNKYVCLIQPHTSFKLAKIQPALFDQFDSIGLLALASYLKSKGYIVEVLHLAKALRNGYTVEQVINKIKERKPVLFGIGNMWVHQSVGMLETAKLIRNIYGDIPIVIGGQHASFFAQDIVRGYFDIIDGVIVGEGEETLHEFPGKTAFRRPWAGDLPPLPYPVDQDHFQSRHRPLFVIYSPNIREGPCTKSPSANPFPPPICSARSGANAKICTGTIS